MDNIYSITLINKHITWLNRYLNIWYTATQQDERHLDMLCTIYNRYISIHRCELPLLLEQSAEDNIHSLTTYREWSAARV
jgi:hypothetical protein